MANLQHTSIRIPYVIVGHEDEVRMTREDISYMRMYKIYVENRVKSDFETIMTVISCKFFDMYEKTLNFINNSCLKELCKNQN